MIEIKNVSTSYSKGLKVIDNMNLTIDSRGCFWIYWSKWSSEKQQQLK